MLASVTGVPSGDCVEVKTCRQDPSGMPGVRPAALNCAATYSAALSRPAVPTPRPVKAASASVDTCVFSDVSEKTAGRVASGGRVSTSGGTARPAVLRAASRRSTDSGESDACHCPLSMLVGSAPSKPRYEYLP